MKILILRFSPIGDIVLSTPVIRLLKTQLDAEVHYATEKKFESILTGNPYIEKLHFLDSSLDENLSDNLLKENFDVIIDLQNNLKTKILKIRLRKRSYSHKKLRLKKFLLVNLKINNMPSTHIVDRYMKVVAPLGVKMDSLGLDYFIPEKDEVENEWLPETHQNGYVAFAIGSPHKTQQLPLKRMIELCDRINKPIILLGGEKEIAIANEIEKFFEPGTKAEEKEIEGLKKNTVIFNACGKFSFNQSASILEKASWVFTFDNDMMHVAAALKKTIYSIWGNTVPSFGYYPYRTKFIIFENNKINCRPCSFTGFDKCPKGHFKCMNDVVFDFYLPD